MSKKNKEITAAAQAGQQKKKPTISRIIKTLFKNYPVAMAVAAVAILLNAVGGISSSVALKYIVDEVITPALTAGLDAMWGKLISLVIVMGGIYLIAVIADLIFTQIIAVVAQKMLNKIRMDTFDKMQSLPIKYFDTHTHGEIMSVYTNDVDTIRQLISQSLPQLLVAGVTIISLFAVMLTYSLWLTLLVVLGTVAMFFVTKKIGGGAGKHFMKQQVSLAGAEGYIEEIMHGQKVVKVFCREEECLQAFDKRNENLLHDAYTANKYANTLMPIMGNIGNIMYVMIAFAGTLLAMFNVVNVSILGVGPLTIGIVVSFLTMSRGFSMSISQVSMEVNSVVMAMAGSARVFALMDEAPEADNGYVTLVRCLKDAAGNLTETKERTGIWAWKHPHKDGSLTYTELKGDILLDDVDFGYSEDKLVLHNVDVYARPGEKVAFVGATGAGKTTITNLINRFYDIADGKIRYDGININKIKKADLRASLGIVLQDTNLFTGTVMDNIRYGRLDATDEECIAAAVLAGADSFITRLPEGYNTLLTGDGSNLSQGQRQLLSIARAAASDTPVMILDEATSSIDTRTEAIVQRGTDRLMAGRTVFVIAHRLSTVQSSDVIMVLEQGRIIERGGHASLIAKKGKYYSLYTGAFELE